MGGLPGTGLQSSCLKHQGCLVSVLGTESERKVWAELVALEGSEGCTLGWWPGMLGIHWPVAV